MITLRCDCCGKDITDDPHRVHAGAVTTRMFLDGKRVNSVDLCGNCDAQTKNNYKEGDIHYVSATSLRQNDIISILDWHGIPDELEPELKEFMEKHHLSFSPAYIGMLRCYCRGNTVVWQTSSIAPIMAAANSYSSGKNMFDMLPSGKAMKEAGKDFLRKAMALPPDELKRALEEGVPLFGPRDLKSSGFGSESFGMG